jgi:carbonic anhydrase/acetyltransferase-like protein (isoleucine patch superfamily)
VGNFARIGSNCTICNHATVPDGADIPDCTAVH